MSVLTSQKNTTLDVLFLSVLSLFFLIYRLGSGSLASWDEALYASVAKDIVRSGDWLKLTLDGSLWSDKPPLAIWITAVFYKLFGVHEFCARLFSALCGVGAVLTTYFFGRQLFNRWTGFLGALVLLSTSQFLRFSRFGMLDAPLTFFMTLALYFFWLGHFRNRHLIFSGIVIGLAVMTKGFAALLIFPVVWTYCLCSGRSTLLWRSSYWVGVMIAVAIALPWHLYQLIAFRGLFVHGMGIGHLFLHSTQAMDGDGGNLYFYIRVLVNKCHPWILVGLFSAPFFAFKAIKDREDESVFLAAWVFVPLVVLSLVRTKLPWYVLPVYPPLSLTVAYVLAKIFRERSVAYVRLMFLVIMALHVPYSHIFDHDYSRDIKGIAPAASPLIPADAAIDLYRYHEAPAASFYLARKSQYLETKDDVIRRAQDPAVYLLIHAKDWEEMGPEEMARRGLAVRASFEEMRLVMKNKT